jgi:GntR family transcriptional repressor for pyruvate dehydrogenase complex
LVEDLENQILAGDLRDAEKLPSERRLAETFNVSRPVIREALRTLSERGLIEVVPARGAYVRAARTGDATRPLDVLFRRRQVTPRQLVEARKMLECQASFLAATRAEDVDLKIMELALARFESSADLLEKARYDITFHLSIARAAHNPVIETMFSSIAGLVAGLMLRSLGDPNVSRSGVPYHREVYEAIRVNDGEASRSAMIGHLLVAERMYGKDYDRSLASLARQELSDLINPYETLEGLLLEVGSSAGNRSSDKAPASR